MRTNQIIAVVAVSLSSALCAASCIQSSESSDSEDADGSEPALERQDAFEQASEGEPDLLAVCLALAPASVPVKEEFCRLLDDPGRRGRCWKHRFNKLEWVGWCYAEFSG